MKRSILLSAMMFLAVMLGVSCRAENTSTSVERPKLVVGIVIDQMRWDYLYRYYDLYCEGGFKRMMREGLNCQNTMINYIPSVTCIGHTSVFTGTVPAVHGMTGNSFFIYGRKVYCCEDTAVNGVGTNSPAGKMSPRNMLCTTIGDELKVATDFNAKVIGVALKDRSAIMPAGHSADGAFWFDYSTSSFVTSTYYMKELPKWVADYNKTIGKVTKDEVQYTNLGNKLTEELAEAAVEGEQLGQKRQTDMLTISFSCTDMVGHKYGTHHQKTREVYVDVDKRLSDLFTFLDKKIGKEQYLAFLTADHGAANNILMLQEHGIPAGGFFPERIKKELDTQLKSKLGTAESPVLAIDNYRVELNHKVADNIPGVSLDSVKQVIIDCLRKDSAVSYVVDLARVSEATLPAVIKEKIINGYYPGRSGDLQLIPKPAYYEIYGPKIDGGTTHGVWNPYDAHIPFLLMGWHIDVGEWQKAVSITDIAPTVCGLINIQMPNGCTGKSIWAY